MVADRMRENSGNMRLALEPRGWRPAEARSSRMRCVSVRCCLARVTDSGLEGEKLSMRQAAVAICSQRSCG